jgi:ATP-dependent exoDNAse (exonuclease V) alpha subunit
MNQKEALAILKKGHNVFLTGSAGTGKTFLLNQFISYLKKKNIRVGITASTGIAATHIGGRTIHSWSGLRIRQEIDDKAIKKLIKNQELSGRIKESRVLIIDEISMLDANRLDLIDEICKKIRENSLPFGGLQTILCGDFLQLPPVDREKKAQFAYESLVWKRSDIKVCYLKKQYRQDDLKFIEILNKIRNNEAGKEELDYLKKRLYKPINYSIKPTKLYTHNTDVDAINNYELSRIPGEEKSYHMTSHGPKELVAILKKGCMAPEELKLKVGAVVMFVKNNFDAGYVNGTIGRVIDFEDNDPVVETKSGSRILVSPTTWNIEEDEEKIIATIEQFPLRLAWAITVHKSQGMSLDVAEIDLSKAFELGMGYVALSRVRTLDGIRLMGINEFSLKVNQTIVEKDREFRELSDKITQ